MGTRVKTRVNITARLLFLRSCLWRRLGRGLGLCLLLVLALRVVTLGHDQFLSARVLQAPTLVIPVLV